MGKILSSRGRFFKKSIFWNFPIFFLIFLKNSKSSHFFYFGIPSFPAFPAFFIDFSHFGTGIRTVCPIIYLAKHKKIDNFEGFSFFLVISPFYERWYQRVSGAPRILSPVISRNQVAKLNILRREARRAGILRDRGCRRGAVGVFFDENHKIKVNLKDFRYFHFL